MQWRGHKKSFFLCVDLVISVAHAGTYSMNCSLSCTLNSAILHCSLSRYLRRHGRQLESHADEQHGNTAVILILSILHGSS